MSKIEIDSKIIQQQRELALIIERYADKNGFNPTAIPSLDFIRASNESEQLHTIYLPALCKLHKEQKLLC